MICSLKLAYKTTGANPETFRLFGQFSNELTDQQIEDNFGAGSSFSPTSYFATGLATFHTIPQAALVAAFPAGSEVIVASNGLESFGIGFVQSNAGSASVSFFDSPIGTTREAPLQLPDGIQDFVDDNIEDKRVRSQGLRTAWIARLEAIKAQHTGFAYDQQLGVTAYLTKVIGAITALKVDIRVNENIGSAGRLVNNGRLFSADWEIEIPGTIATTSDDIILHESIHAYNRLLNPVNGVADNSVLDEQIAQSVSELLAVGNWGNDIRLLTPRQAGLSYLRDFETSLAALPMSPFGLGFSGFQTEWDATWVGSSGVSIDPSGGVNISPNSVAGGILSTRYSDRLNSGLELELITDADWANVEMHSIDLSCSQLATLYSQWIPITLTCTTDLNVLTSAQ